MKQTIKCLVAAFAATLVSVVSFAQVTTASMSGKVTDAQGALQGVAVVAVHEPTGAQFYAITDASGYFYLTNITAGGPYNVKVSCLGYKDVTYTDINVALSDNYVINPKMSEESMSLDAVTVSAEGKTSNMRSDRAGAITSLGRKEMSELPTITRSLNDVLMQTPQAYVSGSNAYIGGGNHRQSYVTVDGAAFNNAFGIGSNLPASGSPISLDALEQVAISITPYDVRQSGFTGGGINAVTRSGTNEVKVTAYGYFKNQDMEGHKVADYKPLTKTPNHYLMYGASVGAPIIKDKLFFFINIEADRSVEPGPTRRLATDKIIENGQLVANPAGGEAFTNGDDGVARPNASILSAVSDYLVNNYGYDPGLVTGYNTETPSLKLLARVDWNINKNHRLNVRYSMTNSKYASAPSTSTTGFANSSYTKYNRTSMYAAYFQNARYYQEQNFSSVAAELNSRFLDGKLNNTLRVSYSHQYEPRSTEGGYFPTVDLVVGGNTYTSFGYESFSYGNLRDVNTIIATDEVSYNAGRHSLVAGVQFEYNMTKNGFQRMGAGAYQFNYADEQSLLNAINNKTLFDNPEQFVITHGNNATFAQEYPRFEYEQLSLYVQDNINLSNNFKLSAGIRFELPFYPSLDFNKNQKVLDATFAEVNGNGGKYDTRQLPKARLSISPRIGFNWDIMGDRKYVLRGGTGIFVGRMPFVWIVAQAGDAGVLQTTVTRTKDQGVPTISNNRNEILGQLYPNGFSAVEAGQNINSITLIDSNLRNPMAWKSSLAFDAVLPGEILASVEGIYNKDMYPASMTNIGLKSPTKIEGGRAYYNNGYYDSQIQKAYLVSNVTDPSLWGYYFSLTAKLEKSFFKGFRGSLAYTYSEAKSINDGVSDQVYSAWGNQINANGANSQELGYASYVMPHRIVGNLSYSKDYAKYFGTSVSLSYYGGPQGRGSFLYDSSILGDGAYATTLISIPTYDDLFGEDKWIFKEYTDDAGNLYTAEQQAEDLWAFIQQDDYLKKNTGKIAERNGAVSPWVHRFDLKINQNFYFYTGAKQRKHTVQLGLDIKNVGNLLNSHWGNEWSICNYNYGSSYLMALTNPEAAFVKGEKPIYKFNTEGNQRIKETYSKYNSFSSTWEMIFSLRYIF